MATAALIPEQLTDQGPGCTGRNIRAEPSNRPTLPPGQREKVGVGLVFGGGAFTGA